MKPSLRIALPVLALGLLALWRGQPVRPPDAAPALAASEAAAVPEARTPAVSAASAGQTASARVSSSPASPQASGQAHPVVDREDDDAHAARQYQARIRANIARLEVASAAARQRGQGALADVMDRRIEGLLRRKAEASRR